MNCWVVLEPVNMTASTFRQPLPGSLEPAAAWGYHGGEPVPGGWRNQPDIGAGPVELTNLFGESIRRWIAMTARQDRFVGTYVLPWGAEVHVTAPMGQHAPELHLTLPGQPPVRLLPATPHRWYVPGLAGTDIAFIPPDSLRISQHGRHLDARRVQAP